jgi:uncharacterized protein (UPF0335 family)
MNFQPVLHAKDKLLLLIFDAYTVTRDSLLALIARIKPSSKVPEDFTTRATLPSWQDYLQANNSQILERIYNNLPEPNNEQALIEQILTLRKGEQRQKQIQHIAVGLYAIAIGIMVLAFNVSLGYSLHEIEAIVEKQTEYSVRKIKDEIDLSLQNKEQEIRDLTQQMDQLRKNQEALQKDIKSLTKIVKPPSKTASDVKPGKEKQRQ